MPSRAYDRTLRAAQAEQTRERVLDALIAALAREDEISVPALAKAARVSVPTVYRYFPTREALMDAAQEAIGARLRRPAWPKSPEELEQRVGDRYAWFEDNGVLIRAILASQPGREVLRSVQRRRERAVMRALAPRVSHLDGVRARAVVAIVSMLDDAHAWRQLRDAWRIRPADAAWAARWATRALLARLAEEQAAQSKASATKGRGRKE
jgi:AcrR family transcriptional regulator